MVLSKEEIKVIKEGFQKDYILKSPYNQYMSKVECKYRVKNPTSYSNEPPESELCLLVGLKENPPDGLELPLEYKGIKVDCKFIGNRRLHSKI